MHPPAPVLIHPFPTWMVSSSLQYSRTLSVSKTWSGLYWQSSSMNVLVPTTPCQGLNGFVGLWQRGLRHWPPWKIREHQTRAGGNRLLCSGTVAVLPSGIWAIPRHLPTWQINSALLADPHRGASIFQCHLHPSTGTTALALCFISVAGKVQRGCSNFNNSSWRTCCFLWMKCELCSCPWEETRVLCRFWYTCKTMALL